MKRTFYVLALLLLVFVGTAVAEIDNLTARAKLTEVQLVWSFQPEPDWDHYNVYRSTGGPWEKIAETRSTYSTYLDRGLTLYVTYYYIVREADVYGNELCESNQVSVTTRPRMR